jgi:hypothetical protein
MSGKADEPSDGHVRLRPTMAGGTTNSETDIFMAHLRIAQQQHLDYHQRARCPRGGRGAPTFCHDCRPNIPTIEGRNVTFEFRTVGAEYGRFPELAADPLRYRQT